MPRMPHKFGQRHWIRSLGGKLSLDSSRGSFRFFALAGRIEVVAMRVVRIAAVSCWQYGILGVMEMVFICLFLFCLTLDLDFVD